MSKVRPKKTLPNLPVPDSDGIKGGDALSLLAQLPGRSQDPDATRDLRDLGSSTPPPPPKRPT